MQAGRYALTHPLTHAQARASMYARTHAQMHACLSAQVPPRSEAPADPHTDTRVGRGSKGTYKFVLHVPLVKVEGSDPLHEEMAVNFKVLGRFLKVFLSLLKGAWQVLGRVCASSSCVRLRLSSRKRSFAACDIEPSGMGYWQDDRLNVQVVGLYGQLLKAQAL